MWKSANTGPRWPHCTASSSRRPLFTETWFIIKTTSTLLFADLVDHKIHLSGFMQEPNEQLLAVQTTGESAEAGVIRHEVSTKVTTLLRWLDRWKKLRSWQHTFFCSSKILISNIQQAVKVPKNPLNLGSERFSAEVHAGVLLFFLLKAGSCFPAAVFPVLS